MAHSRQAAPPAWEWRRARFWAASATIRTHRVTTSSTPNTGCWTICWISATRTCSLWRVLRNHRPKAASRKGTDPRAARRTEARGRRRVDNAPFWARMRNSRMSFPGLASDVAKTKDCFRIGKYPPNLLYICCHLGRNRCAGWDEVDMGHPAINLKPVHRSGLIISRIVDFRI